MKTVCSYCAHEFAQKRKNHQYCRQACRQGKYIQRKNGVLPSVSKSKDLSNPSLSQNLSNPSGANIDGINPTPNFVTSNPSAENKTVNDGLLTDQKIPPTNKSENKIRQQKQRFV